MLSPTLNVSLYKDILNDPNVKALMERFDMISFPIDYMNRLEAGERYDIDIVYDRLKTLGVLTCTVEDFRDMIDQEEGFRTAGNNVFKVGKKKRELLEIVDPDIE